MARRLDPVVRASLLTAFSLTVWLVWSRPWHLSWATVAAFAAVLALEFVLFELPLKSTSRWIHIAFISTFFFSYRM